MESSSTIKKIKLTNFLSFGPQGMELELKPLNVLIGANATGKSNLIEALLLFQAMPLNKIHDIFIKGGGSQWLWKGEQDIPDVTIEVCAAYIDYYTLAPLPNQEIIHSITFTADYRNRFYLKNEQILINDKEGLFEGPTIIYDYNLGSPKYKDELLDQESPKIESLTPVSGEHTGGLLLARTLDSLKYREAGFLQNLYGLMRIYRIWYMNKEAPPRISCPSHLPKFTLLDDASNLALVLNELETHHASHYEKIIRKLKNIYPDINKLTVDFSSNSATIWLHETSLAHPVPALRFSDGLLRYLCLLTVLCHPKPPKLVCIEEPEIGLHPDAIVRLAKLLKEASERTQLIITTHSDILISQLTDIPESVIVCERDEDGTHMNRLEPEKLESWLKDDYLGDVWLSGGIGGTL